MTNASFFKTTRTNRPEENDIGDASFMDIIAMFSSLLLSLSKLNCNHSQKLSGAKNTQ